MGALPGSNTTVVMPALGGVQYIGPNGGVSNNLMLPTAGLTNFVPDPSALVSTNYLGLPAPPGLPAVGPGTTMYPGISLAGGATTANLGASPVSGSNEQVTSITKNYAPSDPMAKKRYGEILKQQMLEKDKREHRARAEMEEWEMQQESKIANNYSRNHPHDPNRPPPKFQDYSDGESHRMPNNREETDQYGWWMSNGGGKKKSRSEKGRDHYPPPPLPWQVDPENNKVADFGKDYKEWYDKQAGVEHEPNDPELPKSVPAQVNYYVLNL